MLSALADTAVPEPRRRVRAVDESRTVDCPAGAKSLASMSTRSSAA